MPPKFSRKKGGKSSKSKKQQQAKTPVTDNATEALRGLEKSPDQHASASETAGSPTLSDPIVQKRSVVEKAEGRPRPSASAGDLDTIKARIKEIQFNLRGHKPSSFADPLKVELKKLKAELKEAEDRLQFGVPEGEAIMEEGDADSDADKEEHSDAEEEQTLQPSLLWEVIPDSQPESQQEPGTLQQPDTLPLPLQPETEAAEGDAASIQYFGKACVFHNNKLTEGAILTIVDLIKQFKIPPCTTAPGHPPQWIKEALYAELLKVEDPSKVSLVSFKFAKGAGEVHIGTNTSQHCACTCLQCLHRLLCNLIAGKLRACISHLMKEEGSSAIVQTAVEEVFEAYFHNTQFLTLCGPFQIAQRVEVSFEQQTKKLVTPYHRADFGKIFSEPLLAPVFRCPFADDLKGKISYAVNPFTVGWVVDVRQPLERANPFVVGKMALFEHTVVNEMMICAGQLPWVVRQFNELNAGLYEPLKIVVTTYEPDDLGLLSSICDRGDGLNKDVDSAVRHTANLLAAENPFCGDVNSFLEYHCVVTLMRRPTGQVKKVLDFKETVFFKEGTNFVRADEKTAATLCKYGSGDLRTRMRELEPLQLVFVDDNLMRTASVPPNGKVVVFVQSPVGAKPMSDVDKKRFEDGALVHWGRFDINLFLCTGCKVTNVASTPAADSDLGFSNSTLRPLREAPRRACCECMGGANKFKKIGFETFQKKSGGSTTSKKRKNPPALASHTRVFGQCPLNKSELNKFSVYKK